MTPPTKAPIDVARTMLVMLGLSDRSARMSARFVGRSSCGGSPERVAGERASDPVSRDDSKLLDERDASRPLQLVSEDVRLEVALPRVGGDVGSWRITPPAHGPMPSQRRLVLGHGQERGAKQWLN
jgi:hypothetical protein